MLRQSPSGPPHVNIESFTLSMTTTVASGSGVDVLVGMAGLPGDVVIWSPREPFLSSNWLYGAGRVVSTNILGLRMCNVSLDTLPEEEFIADVAVFPMGSMRKSTSGPPVLYSRSYENITIPAVEPTFGSVFTVAMDGVRPGDVATWVIDASPNYPYRSKASIGAARVQSTGVVELDIANLGSADTLTETQGSVSVVVFGNRQQRDRGWFIKRPPSGPVVLETKPLAQLNTTYPVPERTAPEPPNSRILTAANSVTGLIALYSPSTNPNDQLRWNVYADTTGYRNRFENAGDFLGTFTTISAGGVVLINPAR